MNSKSKLESGAWIDEYHASDKDVTCIKCYTKYNLRTTKRKKFTHKGCWPVTYPICPNCGSTIYIS
jgi:NAD-dependent SIR2 family protein deacetylase